MGYRTEGTNDNNTTHDTGTYATLEDALLGLQATMKEYFHGSIKEDEEGEGFSLIHMWREKSSPICYTRIHFDRIEMVLEKKRGAPSHRPAPPRKRFETF